MEMKKITPWFNWQEWKTVVDDAYNQQNDVNAYLRAFSSILAWEARDSNIPSALICLKELLMAKLSQINKNNSTNRIDHIYSYQSSISMNIVRFVNFITEPYQKNTFAKPVKSIASTIGLPDWIVNLRHNATHFSLPSIELLEKAIEFLFEWLKERYIEKYKETVVENSLLQNVKSYIQKLFVDYINVRYKTTMMRKKKKSLQNISSELDQKIEIVTVHFRNETFEILLEDGYLIPTKEQLNAIGIVSEEFIEQENLEIPKQFLNIWITFLTFCNQKNLLSLLFQNLVNAYKTEIEGNSTFNNENLRSKFILSWIVCFLKLNSYKNEKSKISKFHFEFNFKHVLLEVLGIKSNSLGLLFLQEIKKISSFSNEINSNDYEKIINLIEFVNEANKLEINKDQLVASDDSYQMDYTDEEAFYKIDLFEKKSNENFFDGLKQESLKTKTNLVKSDWKLIDDIYWNHENLKLGLIDGQSHFNLNLDLKQFYERNLDETLNASFASIKNDGLTDLTKNQINAFRKFSSNFSKDNSDYLKKSLINNYWEFTTSN